MLFGDCLGGTGRVDREATGGVGAPPYDAEPPAPCEEVFLGRAGTDGLQGEGEEKEEQEEGMERHDEVQDGGSEGGGGGEKALEAMRSRVTLLF